MEESWRREYLTYLWSREFYLRKLMDQNLLTFTEFNRIDQLMRQHYHADEAEELRQKEKLEKEELALSPAAEPESASEHISENIPINAPLTDLTHPLGTNPSANTNEELLRKEKRESESVVSSIAKPEHTSVHMSLTDMARPYETNPSYVIQRWLRSYNTIEFLRLWEEKNNPNFNIQGYNLLKEKMESGSFTLTAKQWTEYTSAIGIQSKQEKNGGTFAHPDIAMDFQMWLEPELRLTVVQRVRGNGEQV